MAFLNGGMIGGGGGGGCGPGGVTDHGYLMGLGDDDHSQYIHNAPTASGRNIITPSSGIPSLTIRDASSNTKLVADSLGNLYSYNSYTDAANYERFKIGWENDVLLLDTENAGTGSLRGISVGSETFYVDPVNNRVGIGLDTPYATLTVRSQGTNNTRGIAGEHVDNTTAFSQFKYVGRRSRGSHGSPSAVLANDSLVSFNGAGYKTTGWSNTVGGLYVYARHNWTDTSTPTFITLRGVASGTTSVSEWTRFQDGAITTQSYYETTKIATPATPASGFVRVYAKDDGAGAVNLVALMPDGVETTLAKENSGPEKELSIAVSDEVTLLTTGTAKTTFRMPYGLKLTEVRASVNTAPIGADILVDINQTGSSIFSTRISIDAGEKTSTTAATPYVISTPTLADDAEITIDIDQVGSATAGRGLKIWLIGTRW